MSDTHIKINAVTPRVQYTGNGVTTTFPYEFPIFDETDMVVYEGDDIIESGYTVTGAGETEGGTVVFDTAPDDGAKITLLRNVPIERVTDFQEGGTFRPKNLNDEFDRQTAFVQQVQETLDRSVKVGPTSDVDPEEVLTQVERVYQSIDNVDAVADDISNVNAVASDLTNVDAVASDLTNIDAVSADLTNIDAVNANKTNINAVAGNATNINAVASNAENINAVNANKSNIDAVASNETNINAVNSNKTNIDTCASNISAITGASTQASNAAASAAASAASAELSAQYANDKINQTHISNCITYIPQDIHLTLSSGTLTLKAGSKVYVPNGSGVFDVITIASDLTLTQTWGTEEQLAIAVNANGTSLTRIGLNRETSGTTAPTETNYRWWYDTASNKIKEYNGGSWTNTTVSFPIAIVSVTGDNTATVTSIDQVFNGIGYIGSSVFVVPGVKGLIPNGRNDDGTLRNTAFEISAVSVVTSSDTKAIRISGSGLETGSLSYDEKSNYNYINTVSNIRNSGIAAIVDYSGGKISYFNAKTVFHALDYNDKELIVGWGMPDLTTQIAISTTVNQVQKADKDIFLQILPNSSDTDGIKSNRVAICDSSGNNSVEVLRSYTGYDGGLSSVGIYIKSGQYFKVTNWNISGSLVKYYLVGEI